MEKKWNLQDIRPAESKKRRSAPSAGDLRRRPAQRPVTTEDDGTVRIGVEDGNKKKRTSYIVAFAVFFIIIAGGLIVSFLTGGAEVTVYPRFREPNVNAEFTAFRQPQVGELSYEIMTLEAEGERQVSATGQEQVSQQATGKITIYNETPNTERLIKNTRFRSPDGLIYKITESAVVPGAREDGDGTRIPGTIQANVFADGTGEQYNLAANTRMNVPGYEENNFTELYNNIYAINEEAFAGGFEGLKFIIDETELQTAQQQLRTELRDTLLDRIPGEQPAGFVLFPDAVAVTFETLPAVEYGDNLATIKERAVLQVPIFKEDEFASYIAAATIPGYENEPVRIDDTTVLNFSYTSATSSSSNIANESNLTFELSGKPLIVWTYDEGKLKTDLVNASKTALPTILGGYPAIEKAEATVRPFWQQSFPNDLENIDITEIIAATEGG